MKTWSCPLYVHLRTSCSHAERGHVKFSQDNLAYEQGYLARNYHCGNLFWKDLWARNIPARINYVIFVWDPTVDPASLTVENSKIMNMFQESPKLNLILF